MILSFAVDVKLCALRAIISYSSCRVKFCRVSCSCHLIEVILQVGLLCATNLPPHVSSLAPHASRLTPHASRLTPRMQQTVSIAAFKTSFAVDVKLCALRAIISYSSCRVRFCRVRCSCRLIEVILQACGRGIAAIFFSLAALRAQYNKIGMKENAVERACRIWDQSPRTEDSFAPDCMRSKLTTSLHRESTTLIPLLQLGSQLY